ncbi:hypothetical protein EYS14_15010 [Alteromonadaceae bacterium M269]|nr:hypothetical protein EYS14_15010 [Alteromonadaceae bacterium M269]
MKYIVTIALLLFSFTSNAGQWTSSQGKDVGIVNPGAFPGKSSFITLIDETFAGCSRNDGAALNESNPNYNEIYSLLLAAKMGEKKVRIYYEGCLLNLPVIKQAYIL